MTAERRWHRPLPTTSLSPPQHWEAGVELLLCVWLQCCRLPPSSVSLHTHMCPVTVRCPARDTAFPGHKSSAADAAQNWAQNRNREIERGRKRGQKASGRRQSPEPAWMSFCHRQWVLAWTQQTRHLREVAKTVRQEQGNGKIQREESCWLYNREWRKGVLLKNTAKWWQVSFRAQKLHMH